MLRMADETVFENGIHFIFVPSAEAEMELVRWLETQQRTGRLNGDTPSAVLTSQPVWRPELSPARMAPILANVLGAAGAQSALLEESGLSRQEWRTRMRNLPPEKNLTAQLTLLKHMGRRNLILAGIEPSVVRGILPLLQRLASDGCCILCAGAERTLANYFQRIWYYLDERFVFIR